MTLKYYIFGILLSISTLNIFAQGEADNWFFGANAGVNFSSGSPVNIPGGQLNTLEGCASISDGSGNLLFYSDGSTVWNVNHTIMLNGTGLNGDDSSTSSALIVPSPNNDGIYYIFTVDEPHHDENQFSNHGLNYTAIDMSLDGGNGGVVTAEKNIQLITYVSTSAEEIKYKCSEKITAVKSSDCSSFWVVTHFKDNFYSFKVETTGVNPSPVTSNTPTTVPLSGYRRNALGYVKSSPDGSKLAVAHYGFATTMGGNAEGGVFLYDFDNDTGIVSNEEEIYPTSTGDSPYGVEFSSNGEKLYATLGTGAWGGNPSLLVQYDLTSSDIAGTQTLINSSSSYSAGALQLAPDGKIYRALLNFNTFDGSYLGVINNPEQTGAACNYVEAGFAVNNTSTAANEASRIGLPPFIQSLFIDSVDIIQDDINTEFLSLCEGESYNLHTDDILGATYSWTLDGNPIGSNTFEFLVSVAGEYRVDVDPNNGDCPYFGIATISINPLPTVFSITDYELCDDDLDGFISTFDLTTKNNDATGGDTDIVASYYNTLADAEAGTNPIDATLPYTNTIANTEVIYVQLLNTVTGCSTTTQFNLVVNPLPIVVAITDYELCDDDTDGFVSTFDLTTKNNEVTGGTIDTLTSYYNSLADAQAGTNPIDATLPYTNTIVNTEVIYVQLLNTVTGCSTTTQFNLVVNPLPVVVAITDYELCDDDLDGFVSTFDLTTKNNEATGGATDIVASYYNTLADAQAGTNPIDATLPYTNTIANTEVIYVQLLNTVTGCNTTTQFNLVVNPLPIVVAITDYELCDDDADGFVSTFDLTSKDSELSQGDANIVVSYHTSLTDAETGINPIDTTLPYTNTIANTEVIYVQLLNTVTGCNTTSQFNLVVNSLPVLFNATLIQCDEDGTPDGFTEYNLTQANDELLGGDATGYSFTYHLTPADAIANANAQTPIPFTNTVNPQTIYVAVTNDATGCVNYTDFVLDVTATDISDASLEACDDDYDGFTTFTLSDADAAIIAAIAPTTGTLTVAYYENNNDAILEINQLPDNYINTSSPQTIYVRVDNDNDCFGISTIDLTVLPLPAHNTITTLEECSDTASADFDLNTTLTEILAGNPITDSYTVSFYESQADADLGNNPITSPYNAFTNTTVYVRVVNDATLCAATTMSFELLVFPRPVITDPQPIDLCDDDTSDGITLFDLTTQYDTIIGDNTAVTVTYYTNQADAIAGTGISLITTPEAFTNTVNPQIIYIRVQDDTNGCPSFTTLTLNVVAAPDTFTPDALIYCDEDNDGFGNFNLEEATSQITGGSTSPIVAVTYHETLAEAEAGLGAIDTSVSYANIDDFLQIIYVRVALTTTGCFNLTQLELHVINSPILPLEDIVYSVCDDYEDLTDGLVLYDLTAFNAAVLANIDPTTTISDYTVAYYTALDIDGNPDPATLIANPTAFQNTVVPDQVIYISVTRNDSTACESVRSVTLHVDLLPNAVYSAIHTCDDDTADGFVSFNLIDEIPTILDGATGLEVNFYTVQDHAIAGTGASLITNPEDFTNTANPQAIFAHVLNPLSGCDTVSIIVLHVDPNPTPLSTLDIAATLGVMMACDGNVDGSGAIGEQIANFDLTQWEVAILTGDGPGIEVGVSAAYYTSYDEAVTTTNPIIDPTDFQNTSNPQTIFVRVTNDVTGCYTIVSFELFVPVPNVSITGDTILCVDQYGVPLPDSTLPVLTAVAGPPPADAYNYQWALNDVIISGETGQTITVSQAGTYTVTVAGPLDMSCINMASHTVTLSGSPSDFNANVTTNAFADMHQIVASATSSTAGIVFWYSLDGGTPNTSGVFNDVSVGSHTITITDAEGCWSETITVMVIDYPKFFTPNNDGHNDTWQIVGISDIAIAQIYIFDRYGKLLKQLDPNGAGWDGTFNGAKLPATDYWFKIIYLEGNPPVEKEFRAHFSLKR